MNEHFYIRQATIQDAAKIAQVKIQIWRETFTKVLTPAYLASLDEEEETEKWVTYLSPTTALSSTYIGLRSDRIVGYAVIGPSREEAWSDWAELWGLYLQHEFHGRGWGKALFMTCIGHASARGQSNLWLKALTQTPAPLFYQAMGGEHLRSGQLTWGGVDNPIDFYGWKDIGGLIEGGGP